MIRSVLLVCVIESGCSKGVFKELADFILSDGSVEIPSVLCRLVFVGDLWRDKKEHRFGTVTWKSFVKFNRASLQVVACVRFRFNPESPTKCFKAL